MFWEGHLKHTNHSIVVVWQGSALEKNDQASENSVMIRIWNSQYNFHSPSDKEVYWMLFFDTGVTIYIYICIYIYLYYIYTYIHTYTYIYINTYL